MDYYFNGSDNGDSTDWSDSNNWWAGPGKTGGNTSVPSSGILEDVLYFETNCATNIPTDLSYNIVIQSGAIFTISDPTSHVDQYYITVSGTLNLNASFTGYNVVVNSSGVCNITSIVYFYAASSGSINSGATINVASGALTLYTYNINTAINVVTGSITYVSCAIATSPLLASGTTISISNSTVSTNLTIGSNVSLSLAACVIASSFTITNNGSMSIAGASGQGSLVNNNSCTITSDNIANTTFTNNGTCTVGNTSSIAATTFTNNGTCTVNSGGTLNSGTFTNNGTTTVNGTMSINSSSVYTNNGTFSFGSSYSTAFKGRIFPQVPSSASWGNALL